MHHVTLGGEVTYAFPTDVAAQRFALAHERRGVSIADAAGRAVEMHPRTPVADWAVRVWVLELPFQTPVSLNDRMKWQHAHAVKKPWREAAAVLARAAKIPPCLLYTSPSPRD